MVKLIERQRFMMLALLTILTSRQRLLLERISKIELFGESDDDLHSKTKPISPEKAL